jgi:hypothetical protein
MERHEGNTVACEDLMIDAPVHRKKVQECFEVPCKIRRQIQKAAERFPCFLVRDIEGVNFSRPLHHLLYRAVRRKRPENGLPFFSLDPGQSQVKFPIMRLLGICSGEEETPEGMDRMLHDQGFLP